MPTDRLSYPPVADAVQRMWQEQQLKARQMVLQQQAASAAQAASKTQREVCWGMCLAIFLVPGVCMSRCGKKRT